MTILSLHSKTTSSEIEGMISSTGSPQTVDQIWSIPRINLRKRPAASAAPLSNKMANLESVNSAFLSGIFADVAKAAEGSSSSSSSSSPNTKKARSNQTSKTIQRCDRSFAVLLKSLNDQLDDDNEDTDPTDESRANANTATNTLERENSLLYQLKCVTTPSSNHNTNNDEASSSDRADVSSAAMVAFPYLPATVSNSSCGNNNMKNNHSTISSPITTLTHVISDLQSSVTEKSSQSKGNDTYGWFVEMEDETTPTATVFAINGAPMLDAYFAPRKDLAFTAQVAPKAENYDAELEWATAADTVDDVLGCFF